METITLNRVAVKHAAAASTRRHGAILRAATAAAPRTPMGSGENWRELMRALIAGGGMAGLMTALAVRESGVFTTIDVFEQTPTPSTAGAGLNIPPNAARLAQWLGVDLDGGDPKGPHGAIDGGRAAIL